MQKQSTRAFLTVSFALTVFVTGAYSQQSDIPPVTPAAGGAIPGDPATSAEATRIVEGRPGFYWMKRNLHPISWLEAMARPPAKLAERGATRFTSQQKSTKVSGVKLGIRGTGSSSGAG